MADSNATYNRSVTVDLPDYASGEIEFRLKSDLAIAGSETFPVKTYTLTLDANGQGTQVLPVPDNTGTDSWEWDVILPNGAKQEGATLAYAGSAITLAAWLASAASSTTANSIADQYVAVAGDTMTGKLQFSGTDHEGIVPVSLTTAQRDAIASPGTGAIIWNSTNSRLERYTGAAWADVADIGTYSGHINVLEVGHSPTAGDIWSDGAALHFYPIGAHRSVLLANGVVMSGVTVADTTTETTVYTESIPANELYKGSKWHVKLSGIYSTANASDTFTGRLKLGGTTIRSFTIDAGAATDQFWRCEFFFTVRTIGANGTIVSAVEATTGGTDHSETGTATATIDTTAQQDMTLTIQWDAQHVDNSVSIVQGHTEIFGVKQA